MTDTDTDRLAEIEQKFNTDYYVLFNTGQADMGWLIQEVKRYRMLDDAVRNQAIREAVHKEEIGRLREYNESLLRVERENRSEIERLRHDAIRATWPGYPCTPAQWELSQGEVHDARGLLASIGGGLENVAKGIWTFEQFYKWYATIKANHEAGLLRRFKRVMQGEREAARCERGVSTACRNGQHGTCASEQRVWCQCECHAG